jgi:tripartite-type tricarboxylate transporter receptor subunit TctC
MALGGAPLDGAQAQSRAQDYPNRAVTIVAPAAPGGLYSLLARLIGTKLEQRLGKPFVIENKPGASSVVGALSVIRSPHDGYTLMVGNTTGLATNVSLNKNLPYDPAKDFAPVALLARAPEVLVVNAALPVHTFADLVKLARSTPGGLSYGSAGPGTSQHLSGVMLASALDVPMTHVPYKGMSPAVNDVAGGHIPFMFSAILSVLPLVEAGKLRVLGVTTDERIAAFPEVQPLTEAGLGKFDAASWFMLVAPSSTPGDIVEKLHGEVRAIIGDPEVRAEFTRLGLVAVPSPPPDELKRFVAAEIVRWGDIVKKAGMAGSQ